LHGSHWSLASPLPKPPYFRSLFDSMSTAVRDASCRSVSMRSVAEWLQEGALPGQSREAGSSPVRSTLVAAEERPGAPGLSWWWFAVAPVQAVFVIRFWGPGATGA
jgi:hypothetical protein